MTTAGKTSEYGHATIDPPGPVVAGSYGTWRVTFEAGSNGVATGGSIRVHTECDTDWGVPQLVNPSGADYMTVDAPPEAGVAVHSVDVRAVRLVVTGRSLRQGEVVSLTYGDRSGGGPGSRAQTFLEPKRYFWVDVDAAGNGEATRLDDSPCVSVVGGDAVRLIVTAPSSVVANEPFRVLVKAEDAWGNPSASYCGTLAFTGDGLDAPAGPVALGSEDSGAKWVEGFRASKTGTLRIEAVDSDAGLSARSNPVVCAAEKPHRGLYWADAHGGQIASRDKIGDFFRYARDVSGLDFVGYQRNDNLIDHEDWAVQQREEATYYEPGRFVPLPGFEWSANTGNGGHHNVYFRRPNQQLRRNSHSVELLPEEEGTDLPHILDVYRAYRNSDVLITPHVGGEHADLQWHEPTLEPAMEMTSTHGTFEWILREALERRYRLGFIGGSDSHTGRPGDDRPGHQARRYAKSGLAGVYADGRTLEGFFEALRARRVYATTGARMVLWAEADDHPLGAELVTSAPPRLSVRATGTAPLESVEVFRGLDRVYALPIQAEPVPGRVRVLWTGASRMTSYSGIVWDGLLRVAGGRIANVETVRFDSPRSHVFDVTEDSLRWKAWGCGYPMGLLLDIDGGPDARVEVSASSEALAGVEYGGHGEWPPRRMSLAPAGGARLNARLGDLADGPRELPMGMLNQKVTMSLASEPGPESVEFSFTDRSPKPGINPYWVRVVQSDMEMGWTSPVFVDFVASGR